MHRLTLGIKDGDDLWEIQAEVEAAFKIKLSDEEAARCGAVGALHDLVQAKAPQAEDARACMTQMAFYRLRAALRESAPRSALRPSTPLGDLETQRPKLLFQRLEKACALRMPDASTPITLVAGIASLFSIFCVIPAVLIFFNHDVLWPVATCLGLFVFGVLLAQTDPGAYPAACKTLGDLSRDVALRNFGAFTQAGARPQPDEAWRALERIVGQYALNDKGEIGRETRFC